MLWMAKPLILWDIDSTLVTTSLSAADVYTEAMAQLGVGPVSFEGVTIGGQTDCSLLALAYAQVFPTGDFSSVRGRAIEALDGVTRARVQASDATVEVLPGVKDCLAAFAMLSYEQALLTGNSRERARLKLERFGLFPYFNLGLSQFGDHSVNRPDLAQEALRAWQGVGGRREQVVVIGDTPRDVACARAIGALVIAVASGSSSLEELHDGGEGILAIPSLRDHQMMVRWIEQQMADPGE
ncbi:MAG: HAD family hydrolase [Candidatus Dormibacteria bacterium]